ncbi:uncharacterized protein LOC134836170 isoform X2 [Culicoides brevitarsis]|uniref:uncharacterized protein LOC134836170 isoform X2 n=1 Tax=Culicoides brevitarsis TaxID=469753 RepID=UPI00307BE93E
MNEYEQHGALTDEKREDLSQLVSEFMAKGVVKGGRAGHEAIAEATLILFPGTFEDDPKTLAEALYNRLSRQTQQRYGTESPEVQLLPSELIKQEIDASSYFSPPSPPAFDLASQIILQPPSQSEKYLLASAKLEIPDVESYVKQMRYELRYLAEKWKTDYLATRETTTPLALKLQESPEPQIEVDVDDAGKLYATIECVLCSKIIRIGFNRYKTLEGMKHRLNGGNFNSHLRNHFRDF